MAAMGPTPAQGVGGGRNPARGWDWIGMNTRIAPFMRPGVRPSEGGSCLSDEQWTDADAWLVARVCAAAVAGRAVGCVLLLPCCCWGVLLPLLSQGFG